MADIPPQSVQADIQQAPPAGQYSPDGRWQWNGREWVAVAPQPAPVPTACQVCGGTPAIPMTLRSVRAFVLFGITSTYRGSLCRDCGIALFRSRMSSTLLWGWWGIIHFFINVFAVISNLAVRQQLGRLASPSRPAGTTYAAPGRPVFLRAGFLVTAAVLLLLVGFVTIAAVTPSAPFSAADKELVGTCAVKSGTEWSGAPCSGPHDGKIVSLGHTKYDCTDPQVPVKLASGDWACVDTKQ
ncbi:MAG TPA: hypothetical protein VK131_11655 [Candidatus Acidoferrales bacterium]|nr:hypothetical protein [Candidatus Acidoferrales bacterium]